MGDGHAGLNILGASVKSGAGASLTPLSPLGTARRRLSPSADPSADPAADRLAGMGDVDAGSGMLYLAWQLCAWAGPLPPSDSRALFELVLRCLLATSQGSTRLPLDPHDRALLARTPQIVGAPGDRKPLIVDGDSLYPQKLLLCEDRVAAAIATRAAQPGPYPTREAEAALRTVCEGDNPRPSAEQAAAVGAALRGRLTVISGGPGTGKTTIVLTLLRALVRLGVPVSSVALAAPTGKAANRLDETLKGTALVADCPPALTLHRLLGYSPGRGTFLHHRNNRLAQKVIVVDEASMIDLRLMDRLLGALPDDASLVLLGDADQLPSVEAGSVFKDLAPLAVRLTRSHRVDPTIGAAGDLLALAQAVRDGVVSGVAALPLRPSAAALVFDGVEMLAGSQRESLLERWYSAHIAPLLADAARPVTLHAAGFDDASCVRLAALAGQQHKVRLLCLTHGRPTGVDAVNAWLHRQMAEASQQRFVPGQPVMMLRNDYDRGLFNGDQGVIVPVRADGFVRLRAAFPTRTGWAAWDVDGWQAALALSFAMTVHKAQGSEFDHVALVLPDEPLPLLTREILYTALTRSRRSVVICGSPAVLAAGVANPMTRWSGLAGKVAARRVD